MKKIVGILAASAVLASSVFAADVAAKVKLTGSLIDYNSNNKGDKTVKMLNVDRKDKDEVLTIAIDDENVGAKVNFKIWNDSTVDSGKTDFVKVNDTLIWFKPIDVLKVSVGNAGLNLSDSFVEGKHVINTDRAPYGVAGDPGYTVEFNNGTFFVAGGVYGGAYGTAYVGTESMVRGTRVKAGATIDGIGSFAVLAAGADNFGTDFIGAEYKAAFLEDNLEVLAEAGVYFKDFKAGDSAKLMGVPALLSAQYKMDALKVGLDAYTFFITDSDAKDTFDAPAFLSIYAKASYALGNLTPYVKFGAVNLMKGKVSGLSEGDGTWVKANGFDDMLFRIEPGVDGTFGIMGWHTAAEVTLFNGSDFEINVPVEFSVAF
jgi:hypothetical protein